MALVQRFGKPDLFIIMTCNPKWPEVTELLRPLEKPNDRPDILAHIFRAKVVHLKYLIVKERVFGNVAAHVDVVEFQKRGLPHVHMLIILDAEDKILNPDKYDDYVKAELPVHHFPALRAKVVHHMIHEPCGRFNPRCGCMKEKGNTKVCRFKYPKDFCEVTTCGTDTYPLYKRSNNKDCLFVRGKLLDNRWVTPYNPSLLMELVCHINVEICSTIKAVKYIYKYVYKEHGLICFDIERDHGRIVDEPKAFQSARWVSPPETSNVEGTSTLEYLYSELPEFNIWDGKQKIWRIRDQRGSVGRMAFVSPAEGERYYLRLLLCNVNGATSFALLKTVNGHVALTFKEACEKRGLLEQDNYADVCMQEATTVQMSIALRRLFAILLIYVDGINARNLWNKYCSDLSEDFAHAVSGQSNEVTMRTYVEVQKYIESMGRSMKEFCIPEPELIFDCLITETKDNIDALNAPVPTEYVDAVQKLKTAQRGAFDCIMDAIFQDRPGAFFVDGLGGTGKMFLYCVLYTELRKRNKIVLPTATSGIAASSILTGRTAHSRFKIPIDTDGCLSCSISKQSSVATLLRSTSLFLWDEAPMARKEEIEVVDLLLQDLCSNKLPFGGKVFVFDRDFRQILPVLPHKGQNEAVNASLVSSYIWPLLTKFKLSKNIRTCEDPEFSSFLVNLGDGLL